MTGTSPHALTAEWDERYTSFLDRLPARRPNPAIVAETSRLPTGSVLDIGCGIGSDAIWLAGRGWEVTAIDVSSVALRQADTAATQAGVQVRWVQTRLEDLAIPPGRFDLVTAHYPALLHSPGRDAERALLGSVAAGGILLVVHHADVEVELARSHGFDPSKYLLHDDVVALFDADWDVTVDLRRPRDIPAGPDGQHTHDDVIVARRRS